MGIRIPDSILDVFPAGVDVGSGPQVAAMPAVVPGPEAVEQLALVAGPSPTPVAGAHLVEMVDAIGRDRGVGPTAVRPQPARDMRGHAVPAVALGGRARIVRSRLALERGHTPQSGNTGFRDHACIVLVGRAIENDLGSVLQLADAVGVDRHGREQGRVFARKGVEGVLHGRDSPGDRVAWMEGALSAGPPSGEGNSSRTPDGSAIRGPGFTRALASSGLRRYGAILRRRA
jgi:hypothetical protein